MSMGEMAWDISQLVESTDPASIREGLKSMVEEAETLREKYRGKIRSLDPKGLLGLLEAQDDHVLRFEGADMYCRLMYAADSTDDTAKQLNDATRRASMREGQALAFIGIELAELFAEKPLLIADPVLAEYKHYLERILRRAPHMLTETEERLILVKDMNGVSAWQMLQSDWLSTRTFNITIGGETKTLPYGEIIGFYQSPDRDLRRRANEIVYMGLGRDQLIWASAMRAVCGDHLQVCGLRKYPTPMTQSLIANDVDSETVNSLMRTVEKNTLLYHRYLRLKARLLNLEKLASYDLTAPLPNAFREYSWSESREEVVEAYSCFDEEIGRWVDEMFVKRHIDGAVRNGKSSGAFCSAWLAGKSAYVLESFNGKLSDVYTHAHELGHAVHAYLASRIQKPSNYQISSCIAETGSTFGELILTEHLLHKAETTEEKQAILANMLDEFGIAAFQVASRVFFEQSLYEAICRGEFLDGETVAAMWVEARDRIFTDSVEWREEMRWEWTMKPHYYIPNYRFYNYPYVFAQLFVFALYKLYREQGRSFVPKLKKLLAAGSSKSPRELAGELGFDISAEEFWQKGMDQAKEFIDMLEETLGK